MDSFVIAFAHARPFLIRPSFLFFRVCVCVRVHPCIGMKLGETRKLRIPAHEGYGKNGFPAVPGPGTLLFEIEVLEVPGSA